MPESVMSDFLNLKKGRLGWTHWAIIGFSLLLTLFAWYLTHQQAKQQSKNAFELETRQMISAINQRMQKYEDALWGGAAHITVMNNHIDEKSWEKYAGNLNLTTKYPGINGIGVIYVIKRKDRQAFVAQQRKSRSYFKIYPEHQESRLFVIVYIEPHASNKQAIGLDMAHELNRYTAVLNTEATGLPNITGPITLVQDAKKTPGFLLFVPLFKYTPHKELIGFVYAPFIMQKLMQGILGDEHPQTAIQIFDGKTSLYHEEDGHSQTGAKPLFHKIVSEQMYGRTWKIHLISTPLFDRNNVSNEPTFILVGGITLDAMLLLVFLTLTRANKKTLKYAKEVTKDLNDKTIALDKLAYIDQLTGLPNRTAFFLKLESSLEKAKKNNIVLAICIIDIDDFKRINDSRGYEVGDDFLRRIGNFFTTLANNNSYVARLGADEFGLIVKNVKSHKNLLSYLARYESMSQSQSFSQPLSLPLSISIGAAIFPSAGATAKDLYISADIANNAAKVGGKNQCVIFNEGLSYRVKRHHELDFSIRQALKKKEFSLVYQPQLDLVSHQLVGFEALMRWKNGLLGDVLPNEFITIAEENGKILEMGRWLIQQVCTDLEYFKTKTKNDSIKISLNSSIVEILDPDYVLNFEKTLETSSIQGNELCVEVTESVLMADPAKVIKTLNAIRGLDIKISLDDFGTGYSSLQYLKDLPVSMLKIDKSFVDDLHNPDSKIIVQNIIQLGQGLGLKVLAEGAEEANQIKILQELGCDYVQGYYFYKPMSITEAAQKFNENSVLE